MTRVAWVVAALFVALFVASAYGIVTAWRSRTVPSMAAVNLAFPLGPGSYLIVNGGSHISTNAHLRTLDTSVDRFRAWRGQSHGVDIVQINAFGLRIGDARGVQPRRPEGLPHLRSPNPGPAQQRQIEPAMRPWESLLLLADIVAFLGL